jgi:hypothetical protein
MFELLGDQDWRERKTVVDGLVRDAREEIVERLLDALADSENAGKRNSATEALVRIGEPSIAPIVARLRREPDIDVRLSLVNLVGDLRSRDGFNVLTELLDQEHDVNVASSIVSSLGKYRDASALPHLVRVLGEREDLWLKFHVIEALGEIGDRAALPAILPLYAEKSLRKPVLEAVGKIAGVQAAHRRTGRAAAHPDALPGVVPAREDRAAHRAPADHAQARGQSLHPQVPRLVGRRARIARAAGAPHPSRYRGSGGTGVHRLRRGGRAVDPAGAAQ